MGGPATKKEGYSFPNKREQIAVEEYENKAAEKINEKGGNESERKHYGAYIEYVETESPTETPDPYAK